MFTEMGARVGPLVTFAPARSPQHEDDIVRLRAAGAAVPHQHSPEGLCGVGGRWLWARVTDVQGHLLGGFVIHLTRSLVLPWTWIGRVERVGRALHQAIPDIGVQLARIAGQISGLQRLEVEVFDEDDQRRLQVVDSLVAAGARLSEYGRGYCRTLVLDLTGEDADLMARVSQRARRSLRKFESAGLARVAPISDVQYLPRMLELYQDTFARTGKGVPATDFDAVLRSAQDGQRALLAGVFWDGREAPRDLVAFLWGRLHGDCVSYDIGASERAEDLGRVPLGYPLMFYLARWGRAHGASWLDLGGISLPGDASSGSLHGISEFKRSFSVQELAIASEYAFFPRPVLARVADGLRAAARAVKKPLSLIRARTADHQS